MNLRIFANDVAVADPQISLLPLVGLVLRRCAERRARMDLVVCADLGQAREVGMGHHARAALDLDRTVDHDIGADVDRRIDLGFWIDNCRGMNTHGFGKLLVGKFKIRIAQCGSGSKKLHGK